MTSLTDLEGYFFHGTDCTRIESIAINGFDPRVSKVSGNFGTGIYFGTSYKF
jgi:hypothetical protein